MSLTGKEIAQMHKDYVMQSWSKSGVDALPVERAEGIYFYDYDGNKYADMASLLVCSNLGHELPEIVNAINKHHIAASVSNTAGTFVCNHVLYGTRYYLEHHYPNIKSGFIHVPFIKEQGEPLHKPYMELEDIVKGIEITLETIISR